MNSTITPNTLPCFSCRNFSREQSAAFQRQAEQLFAELWAANPAPAAQHIDTATVIAVKAFAKCQNAYNHTPQSSALVSSLARFLPYTGQGETITYTRAIEILLQNSADTISSIALDMLQSAYAALLPYAGEGGIIPDSPCGYTIRKNRVQLVYPFHIAWHAVRALWAQGRGHRALYSPDFNHSSMTLDDSPEIAIANLIADIRALYQQGLISARQCDVITALIDVNGDIIAAAEMAGGSESSIYRTRKEVGKVYFNR